MALVTAYLARTAPLGSAPDGASLARRAYDRVAAFLRVSREAWIEARALEREMKRRYPHIDG
jgi:propanediol dehydratase large subunit